MADEKYCTYFPSEFLEDVLVVLGHILPTDQLLSKKLPLLPPLDTPLCQE